MNIQKSILSVVVLLMASVVVFSTNSDIEYKSGVQPDFSYFGSFPADSDNGIRMKVADNTECNPRVTICDEK